MLVSKWRYGLVRTRCSKMCCRVAKNFWRSGKSTKLLKIITFLFHQVCHTGIVEIHVMFSEFRRKIATQNRNTVQTQKTCTPQTITKDTTRTWRRTWDWRHDFAPTIQHINLDIQLKVLHGTWSNIFHDSTKIKFWKKQLLFGMKKLHHILQIGQRFRTSLDSTRTRKRSTQEW